MDQSTQTRFSKVLLDAVEQAKQRDYNPSYFIRMISADGPFETVKRIVPKKEASEGFYKLHELGLTNLSCEAIIVETEWRPFFDDDLLQLAEKRLRDFGYAFTPYKEAMPSPSGVAPIDSEAPHRDPLPFMPPQGDSRERQMRNAVVRPGQSQFRKLLIANNGPYCVISNTEVLEVVEAAHIAAYRGPDSDDVRNGLLLRADLHALFDAYLLSISPDDLRVHLAIGIKSDPCYATFHGRKIRLSTDAENPSQQALTLHWEIFQKTQ